MTTADFLENLQRSQLVSAADVATLVRQEQLAAATDPKDLARAFVKHKRLTLFQANQLLHGHSRGFFIDGYRVQDLLGVGGMGAVYLAESVDGNDPGPAVIKVLSERTKHDPGLRARFELEARAGLQLHHENIVRTLKFGLTDDLYGQVPYVVMEFVEGISLFELMWIRQGTLPWPQAADCIRQAADGLHDAHEHGMVHRDVKPTNLLITKDGRVKILDFGLALLKNDEQSEFSLAMIFGHQCLGTDDYIAPEQTVDSHAVDRRADVYSLGCTLYYVLTGAVPYPLETSHQKIEAHRAGKFPDVRQRVPKVPEALAHVLGRMVALSPDDRYPTAAAVSQALAPFCRRSEIQFDFQQILKMRGADVRHRHQLSRHAPRGDSSRSHSSAATLKPSGVSITPAPQAMAETRSPADTTPRMSSVALPVRPDPPRPAAPRPGLTGRTAEEHTEAEVKRLDHVRMMLKPIPDGPSILLDRDRMVIGRAADCAIRLDSTRVSSYHALLTQEGQWWRICDTNSRNGIRVNGVATTDQLLWPGDRILVADHYQFVLTEVAPVRPKRRWWLVGLILSLIVLAGGAGVWFFLLRSVAG